MPVNPVSTLKTLLSDNWLKANTDGNKPKFVGISDQKICDFRANPDWVLIHRPLHTQAPAGIGHTNKRLTYLMNIDLRVYGQNKETHFFNCIEEIDRILDVKTINPDSNFDLVQANSSRQDKSDKTHHIWRMIIPTELRDLVKAVSTS